MDPSPKQQAVERLKTASNILVTVSANPSVDQLAACIGFTLLLNKLGKHATAVFSGAVPSTLEFLQPENTIETNTDSLRDFIIALDKSKADKLRYKVEDEVVRIFITPYRTSITEKDLVYSQGDFNVDAVVALGVTTKEDIDQAIVAHGRILHDATVISVTDGATVSDVGSINWNDQTASSLSEMLVSITESFQSGLLDAQMSTAFLTGIVAETERFSNEKTSPKVMTMSAQLMAAGANQQLIATQLAPPAPEPQPEQPVEPYVPPTPEAPAPEPEPPKTDGEIEIHHDEPVHELTEEEKAQIHIDEQGNLKRPEELQVEEELAKKAAEDALNNNESTLLGEAPEAQNTYAVAPDYLSMAPHKVLQPLNDAIDPLAAYAPPAMPVAVPQPEPALSPEPEIKLPPVAAEETAAPPAPATVMPPTDATAADQAPLSSLPPLPRLVDDSDTLAHLEEAVHSPHLQAADMGNTSVDDARSAVSTAAQDSVPRPQATQAIGSQRFDMDPYNALPPEPSAVQPPAPTAGMPAVGDILQQSSAAVPDPEPPIDPMSPPPVPPPMMPQYLSPPSADQHRGYLNPSEAPHDQQPPQV